MPGLVRLANECGAAALVHPGTSGTRRFFGLLSELELAVSEGAVVDTMAAMRREIGAARQGDYTKLWMPHDAVTFFTELLETVSGDTPKPWHLPAVLPGTWRHDGIEVGQVFCLEFTGRNDPFCLVFDQGSRIARCEVVKLQSDTTGSRPCIVFRDLDDLHEGQASLGPDEFRAAIRVTPVAPQPR